MSEKLEAPGAALPWGPLQQEAFERLKAALCASPVLVPPVPGGKYTLSTDASGVGVGAVLTQMQGEHERVIAYHSRKLNDAERRYTVHERELLGVVDACRAWRHYLSDGRFLLLTDNWANKHLHTQPHLDPKRQARWVAELQSYFDFEIQHVPGVKNVVADALSRRPDYLLGAMVTVGPDEEFLTRLRAATSSDEAYTQRVSLVEAGQDKDFDLSTGCSTCVRRSRGLVGCMCRIVHYEPR
jgi:hypothetical protein